MDKLRMLAFAISAAAILSFTQFPFATTMQTRAVYTAALDRATEAYQDADGKCGQLEGHGKDMCAVEARAVKKRANALAEANYRGTIQARMESRIANADADWMIARTACNAMSGEEKTLCVRTAKASNIKLVSDARS
jgi:predicted secreted protein